jgi:hypothetical protein
MKTNCPVFDALPVPSGAGSTLLRILGLLAVSVLLARDCIADGGASNRPLSAAQLKAPTNQVAELTPYAPSHVSYICDGKEAEPTYQGMSISRWIQTNSSINPRSLPLADLLALKQVSGPDEWGTVRFGVKLRFDPLKTDVTGNEVDLGWFNDGGDFVQCCFEGCERATNGSCVLWWDTNWNSPGRHDLRARLNYHDGLNSIEVMGPALPFYSSNVCQFFEGATFFNSEGTQLYAKLRSPVAEFRVELSTTDGKHLKTVTGRATGGYITNEWDMVDDHGKKFEGDAFVATFYVTHPGDKHPHPPARTTFTRIADQPRDETPKK